VAQAVECLLYICEALSNPGTTKKEGRKEGGKKEEREGRVGGKYGFLDSKCLWRQLCLSYPYPYHYKFPVNLYPKNVCILVSV
jgi:hypothetical protein